MNHIRTGWWNVTLLVVMIGASGQPASGQGRTLPPSHNESDRVIMNTDSPLKQEGTTPKPAAPLSAEETSSTDRPEAKRKRAVKPGMEPSRDDGGQLDQELTEFQKTVQASTGKLLSVYGSKLFDAGDARFGPLEKIQVPGEYQIRTGDDLVIRAWGQIEVDYTAKVDREGNIHIPKVGRLSVGGIRYDRLRAHITSELAKQFKNFELDVTLGEVGAIQVFVVGRAQRPGTHHVSALSTLINAVFTAGGPSESGSLRKIQLRRSGKVIATVDLFEFLLKGDKTNDSPLFNGDVIYIPPVEAQVAIHGSVREPAIYEIHKGATLAELLELSGGLTAGAAGQQVTIKRVMERRAHVVEVFGLDGEGQAKPLRDGDIIQVETLPAKFDNTVTLRGNVTNPGQFPWFEGMRVKDLIPSVEALVTREYYLRKLQVGLPKSGQPDAGETLTRDIRKLVPDVNWDYALVQRINMEDLNTLLLPFSLAVALEGNPTDNLPLLAGDIVTVFSQNDIAVPEEFRSKFVTLEGEFGKVGVYRALPGETLRELVTRTGGIRRNGYLYGARFLRESVRLSQVEQWNAALMQFEMDVERQALRSLPAATGDGNERQESQLLIERQRRLLDRLRTIVPTGRLVLNLGPQSTFEELPEIELEDGDHFIVPSRPKHVNVMGAVAQQAAFVWDEDRPPAFYVRQAGGGTINADEKRTFVIRSTGAVVALNGARFGTYRRLQIMPGDSIVVPENLNKTPFLRSLRDWSQVIGQFALGAAAIQILR